MVGAAPVPAPTLVASQADPLVSTSCPADLEAVYGGILPLAGFPLFDGVLQTMQYRPESGFMVYSFLLYVPGIGHELDLYSIFRFFCRVAASFNKLLYADKLLAALLIYRLAKRYTFILSAEDIIIMRTLCIVPHINTGKGRCGLN